jgi:hypothetical protein
VSVYLPENRRIAREGVNFVQAFFESQDCVFMEVPQQNDFGKDAYVDIGEKSKLTPICIAVQIKSGGSYRTVDGDYFVPVQQHAANWRRSTVPVFGLVYDPADKLVRWVDLTAYLRAHPDSETGRIPISRHAVLTDESLRGDFTQAARTYGDGGSGAVALSLLSAGPMQLDAVFNAWALGRKDAKFLILLRRLILELEPDAVCRAVFLLSHAGSHPDILWDKQSNWIPQVVCDQALPSFRWSPAELAHMIRAVPTEAYGRGTLGQSLDVLLYEDPDIVAALRSAIGLMISDDLSSATRAATLALSHSREALSELSRLIGQYPELMKDDWFSEVTAYVMENGRILLY